MAHTPVVLVSGKDTADAVGGHESYVRAHALAAARAGLEPHIFCFSRRNGTEAADFGLVHHVATPLGSPLPAVMQGPVLSRAVVRFLAKHPGPHLIHSFAIWAAAGVAASRTLAHRGVQAVPIASAYGTRTYEVGAMQDGLRSHHGLADRIRYRAWLHWVRCVDDAVEGWAYANSRLVLVNYESVRSILANAYGSALEIRRIPYASPDAFGPGEAQLKPSVPEPVARLAASQAPLVLAVSRHDPRKGLDLLLLALAELAAAGVAFRACLVGPGRLLVAHRRFAAELGLIDRVAIPGRVEDVRPYFNCADIFVLPSLAEASGSVSIIEAMRAGTPVIASACDGIPEDLANGVEALLVEPGDRRALTSALATLLRSPPLRAQLAANAVQTHQRKFSAEGFVSALASLYTELGLPAGATPRLSASAHATDAMSSSERPGPDGRYSPQRPSSSATG